MSATVYGYDGLAYSVGDRVELHPGTDLWMRGARFGTVVNVTRPGSHKVGVILDHRPGKLCTGRADQFARADHGRS